MKELNHLLLQLDELFSNYSKFVKTNISVKQQVEAFKYISTSILSWDFFIWWKISRRWVFNGFYSKVINSFTQSYYSHVNFCFPYKKNWKLRWYYVFWAENKKWVIFDYYDLEKENDFIYVVKQFDQYDFLKYFDIKQYSLNISFLFWKKRSDSYIHRYKLFHKFFNKRMYYLNSIGLDDLIEFEIFYEEFKTKSIVIDNEQKILSSLYKKIKDKIYDFKEKVWYNLQDIEVEYKTDKEFLDKLFFNWGMLKFLIHSIWIKYDIPWVLSIVLIDRKKYTDYIKNGPKKLFCSELISASMLFAGFYPFDLVTKAPDMVSPWDIMDPSYWMYKAEYTVVNFKTKKILKVNDLESFQKFQKIIKDFK